MSYIRGAISIWHPPPVASRFSTSASLFGYLTITPWSSCTSVNSPSIKDRSPSTRRRYLHFHSLSYNSTIFPAVPFLTYSPRSHLHAERVCTSLIPVGDVYSLTQVTDVNTELLSNSDCWLLIQDFYHNSLAQFVRTIVLNTLCTCVGAYCLDKVPVADWTT